MYYSPAWPDWSLLLLVNIQSRVYTVNKVAYRKHRLKACFCYVTESTTSGSKWKLIPCYYRNKGGVESVISYSISHQVFNYAKQLED